MRHITLHDTTPVASYTIVSAMLPHMRVVVVVVVVPLVWTLNKFLPLRLKSVATESCAVEHGH